MTAHELDREWLARLPEGTEGRLVVLSHFAGLLSHFTNPGRTYADEIADRLKVIACIEDPVVIRKILDHLKEKGECPEGIRLPKSRAPPIGLFT